MSTLDPNAVSNILKTASVTLRNQEARIAELETKLASYETNFKVASIVDNLIERGHLDPSDREQKIAQLSMNPGELPIVEKAVELASSNFKFAGLLTEGGSSDNAKVRFENFLLNG